MQLGFDEFYDIMSKPDNDSYWFKLPISKLV